MIKPKALKKGDKIGIIAPSGVFGRGLFEKGLEAIQNMGFLPVWNEEIFSKTRYMAGSDERRKTELIDMFKNKDIKAIFCARGGYGAGRLLPLLDKETITSNPKIFVGYSDICFLLHYLEQQCSLVAFHGPMVAGDLARGLNPYEAELFIRLLTMTKPLGKIKIDNTRVIREGTGEGTLTGGCLSIIVSSMGTPFELDTKGKIIFLEDTNEEIYRLDRMLTQMKMAGKFDRVKGIIFGNIYKSGEEEQFIEMVSEVFSDSKMPILYRLPAGHGGGAMTLPFGIGVKIDGKKQKIEFLESAVS